MPKVSPSTIHQLINTKFKYHVDSHCTADIEYYPETEDLTIEFQARGTYVYHNFPLDEYINFETAGSRGQYFNNYIRNAGFSYERIA